MNYDLSCSHLPRKSQIWVLRAPWSNHTPIYHYLANNQDTHLLLPCQLARYLSYYRRGSEPGVHSTLSCHDPLTLRATNCSVIPNINGIGTQPLLGEEGRERKKENVDEGCPCKRCDLLRGEITSPKPRKLHVLTHFR